MQSKFKSDVSMRPWESEEMLRARLPVGAKVIGHRTNGSVISGFLKRWRVEQFLDRGALRRRVTVLIEDENHRGEEAIPLRALTEKKMRLEAVPCRDRK